MIIIAFILAFWIAWLIFHPLTGLCVIGGLIVLFILYCIYDAIT